MKPSTVCRRICRMTGTNNGNKYFLFYLKSYNFSHEKLFFYLQKAIINPFNLFKPPTAMLKVGDKFRKFRTEKRMSQKEAGERMGISQNCYQRKEMGETEITDEELLKAAQIFDKPLEDFLKDELSTFNVQYNHSNHQPVANFQPNDDGSRKLLEALVESLKSELATERKLSAWKDEKIDSLMDELRRLKGF